ncbi:MAG: hypothetical protein V1833_01440 [Elusimicrobiota bacterium]
MPHRKSKTPNDPKIHREKAEEYIKKCVLKNHLMGNKVKELFDYMKGVLGDFPTVTWKFKETSFINIQFRLRDKKTERWRDFLLLSGYSDTKNIPRIHMCVIKRYVKPEYETLFPIVNDYHGRRHGVVVYEEGLLKFSIKIEKYKSVLKSIAKENSYYPLPVSESNID